VLDVRDSDAVEAMAAKVDADHGRIDFLLNNAAGNFIVPAEQLSINGWNSVIGIVLNGTFYCSSAVGKRMIERKTGGVMLNVIANYAWTGGPGVIHSASAKAGVLAMTRTLAVEWARHKIRVNAIAPGPVDTPGAAERLFPDPMIMEGIRKTIPLRRFANLEEIAQSASYLLSDYASYVTGENFVIDGGQWLSGADYFTRLKQMMPK
jgi:NAD(P)-dependent dehydrogenase (short-subunit alcohol dehydrogenase family)